METQIVKIEKKEFEKDATIEQAFMPKIGRT